MTNTVNLILTFWRLFQWVINVYSWVLVAYALLSWVPQLANSPVGRFIYRVSEPYVSIFRRLPLRFAGLDFSVLAALFSLQIIERFVFIILQRLLS